MNTLANRLCIVPLSVTLASCMVLPQTKGPSPDSRANIRAEVPAFIVAGTTSRTEVLLRLGEPDGAAADDSRFIYVQRAITGGYSAAMCGYNRCSGWGSSEMAYDRLNIQFDDKNVVTSARHEQISCTEKYDESHDDDPCVDVANLDLILKTKGMVFPDMGWCRGALVKGWDLVRASPPCLRGSLVIGDTEISLYPANANNKSVPILTLSYAEISNIEKVEDFLGFLYGISLTRTDGSHDSIGGLGNRPKMAELLLPRWKAATAK